MDPLIGQIMLFTGNFAPNGWFTCEGQTLAINQYQALFSILGTTYGGDGVTTFKLPDLRGAFATQCTNISGSHPGGTYSFGQTGGTQSTAITAANMPPHTHTILKGAGSNISGTVNVTTTLQANTTTGATAAPAAGNFLGAVDDPGTGTAALYNTTAGNISLGGVNSVATSALNFDPTGLTLTPWGSGSAPVPTTPNFVAMQYIIAWAGIYPSRP